MTEMTRILGAVEKGDRQAADKLLPLVYDELRKLAAQKLVHEKPGQTLQPTALVHEAYLKLVGASSPGQYENSRHFFLAAAEAMRRILIDRARGKVRDKRGGQVRRQALMEDQLAVRFNDESLLACHDTLEALERRDSAAAAVVKLHVFLGMTLDEVATTVGTSPRTVYRDWQFARSWLFRAYQGVGESVEV